MMKVELWVSILLAIPLAIIANLLTPAFQSLSSRLSSSWAMRVKQGMGADLCAFAGTEQTEKCS